MDELPSLIFLAVMFSSAGYGFGNARLNPAKIALFALYLVPMLQGFYGIPSFNITMLAAFAVGFIYAKSEFLEDIGYTFSNPLKRLLDGILYARPARSAQSQKAEEPQSEAHQQSETEDEKRAKEQAFRKEQQRRAQEARDRRESPHGSQRQQEQTQQRQSSQRQSGSHQSHSERSYSNDQSNRQKQSNTYHRGAMDDLFRASFLKDLELDPDKDYSQDDVKKAYRRMAAKYHPDKHQGAGEEIIKEMERMFNVVRKAYDWLQKN